MKTWCVFILLLLSSVCHVNACGFHISDYDLRYCFFRPEYFGFKTFNGFHYSPHYFESGEVYGENDIRPNDRLWYNYCNGKVPMQAVTDAVYKMDYLLIDSGSTNAMIQYLYKIKDTDALNYLRFAKKCEAPNSFYDDPWERKAHATIPLRDKLIDEALALAAKVKNQQLKRRYMFQAVRLCYYNQDFSRLKSVYDSFFSNVKDKDIVYYWSLYFRIFAEDDKALATFYSAQVFANAPDKRFALYNNFHIAPTADVLKYANTDDERANVYLLAAINKPDAALNELMAYYRYAPKSGDLNFLLLREINKIEDWVYTPYYSYINPSIDFNTYDYNEKLSPTLLRVGRDRQYAGRLLQFIKGMPLSRSSQFLQTAIAQLQFITQDYHGALAMVSALSDKIGNDNPVYRQLQMIKALALTASQQQGKAVLTDDVKQILLKNKDDRKFIFAVGRELEYKGNTLDAALLYSKASNESWQRYTYDGNESVLWRGKKAKSYRHAEIYSNYFDYIDVYYTPQQLSQLIDVLNSNEQTDAFTKWQYSFVNTEKDKLYDLLGTKYMRQDKLAMAHACFKKIGDSYWIDYYSLWEKNDGYGYNIFDKDPFTELNNTPSFVNKYDSIQLNKLSVTGRLITFLAKAENAKEKDRDYYYFLAANCYLNMTQYGNSWMMKRFSWTSQGGNGAYEDAAEFKTASLAKKYYGLALKTAKTKKFRALCLTMMGRCESYSRDHEAYKFYLEYQKDLPLGRNPYYKKLEKLYEDDYYKLADNCIAFSEYFKARR